MSYAARARAQSLHQRSPKKQRQEPAQVHRYDPAREVACRALGLAYGEVFVDQAGSVERSHEIGSSRDTSVFIDGATAFHDRQKRSLYRDFERLDEDRQMEVTGAEPAACGSE